jgi:hypothetical protein
VIVAVLTKTQLDHARLRIEEARNAYIERKMAAHGERPEVKSASDAEKLDMIYKGVARLKPRYSDGRDPYGHLTSMFEYPKDSTRLQAEAARAVWDDAALVVKTAANKIEQGLLDELIMSPDGAAALARIAGAFLE